MRAASLRTIAAGFVVWLVGAGIAFGAAETTAVLDATAVRQALRAGRPGPIARSVDAAVDELIRRHFSSCGSDDAVPCFPITVERKWQYSVADSLNHLEFDSSPSPHRPPTVAEMGEARPGPLSASGGVGFDPVCKGRQLLKAVTGKSRTYYLYRVWDATGEQPVLRDHPLDADEFGAAPRYHYVALGQFSDECEALAAWRQALRETRARQAEVSGTATLADRPPEPSPLTTDPESPSP
jgi:hypothetical protein